MPTDARAVIVGGGPVGLAVASLLGRAGWDVIVLEARNAPTRYDESRAITWMPEGLLFADELGITNDLRARASIRTRHEFRDRLRGDPILTVRFDRLAHRHPYTLNLPQHESERLLEATALGTGHVDVRRGWTVTEVRQSGEGVSAAGTDASGRPFAVSATLGVAADGAGSVRRGVAGQLGVENDFSDYGARTIVADVEVDTEPAGGAASWVALDARRPTGAFRFGDRRWRLIYRINAGESDQSARSPEMVARMAGRAWPSVKIDRTIWTSAFQLGQGQSRAYSNGRWVLVGDAAHAMGPSAGAGMMVGLLGAWLLGQEMTAGRPLATAFGRYEERQRHVSRSVQRGNAMIFRNLAVTSPAVGAVRAVALRMLASSGLVSRRLAASEALVGEAPGHASVGR